MNQKMRKQGTIKIKKSRMGGAREGAGRMKTIEGEIITRTFCLGRQHLEKLEAFRKTLVLDSRRISISEALRTLIEEALN
jgi:hypothetical protein